MSRHTLNLIVAIPLLTAAVAYGRDYNSTWTAASGRVPGNVCPTWLLANTAALETPHLEGDTLVMSTSTYTDIMYYEQSGTAISIPDTLRIEFRMKLVAGGGTGPAYAPFATVFIVAANKGNRLWIGPDEIFLWSADGVKGASASVDTDNDFHTYRIEVVGGTSVSVYYDDAPTLSGAIYTSAAFGLDPTIRFGDCGDSEFGTEKLLLFRHNGYAIDGNYCPCWADPNCDGIRSNLVDVAMTIGVALRGGLSLVDVSCPTERTDVNCSGFTDIIDVVKTIEVAFRAAKPATTYCNPCVY